MEDLPGQAAQGEERDRQPGPAGEEAFRDQARRRDLSLGQGSNPAGAALPGPDEKISRIHHAFRQVGTGIPLPDENFGAPETQEKPAAARLLAGGSHAELIPQDGAVEGQMPRRKVVVGERSHRELSPGGKNLFCVHPVLKEEERELGLAVTYCAGLDHCQRFLQSEGEQLDEFIGLGSPGNRFQIVGHKEGDDFIAEADSRQHSPQRFETAGTIADLLLNFPADAGGRVLVRLEAPRGNLQYHAADRRPILTNQHDASIVQHRQHGRATGMPDDFEDGPAAVGQLMFFQREINDAARKNFFSGW